MVQDKLLGISGVLSYQHNLDQWTAGSLVRDWNRPGHYAIPEGIGSYGGSIARSGFDVSSGRRWNGRVPRDGTGTHRSNYRWNFPFILTDNGTSYQ